MILTDHDQVDLDHLFTPEVIFKLDAAIAEADAGRIVTMAEVNRELDAQREEWLANHHSCSTKDR